MNVFKKNIFEIYRSVDLNQITVKIGSSNKLRGQAFGVKRLFIHPKYMKNLRIVNDIALIELKTDIQFNTSFANRVCAPLTTDPIDRSELTAFTGWGQTSSDGRQPTNTLKKAFYYTIPPNQCKYKTENFVCVNASQGVGCSVSLNEYVFVLLIYYLFLRGIRAVL